LVFELKAVNHRKKNFKMADFLKIDEIIEEMRNKKSAYQKLIQTILIFS
jgi:hypothetical protein